MRTLLVRLTFSLILTLLLCPTLLAEPATKGAVRAEKQWLVFTLPMDMRQKSANSNTFYQNGSKRLLVRKLYQHPGKRALESLKSAPMALMSRDKTTIQNSINRTLNHIKSWESSANRMVAGELPSPSLETAKKLKSMETQLVDIRTDILRKKADPRRYIGPLKKFGTELENLTGNETDRYLFQLISSSQGTGGFSLGDIQSETLELGKQSYPLVVNNQERQTQHVVFVTFQELEFAFIYFKKPDEKVVLQHLIEPMLNSLELRESKPKIAIVEHRKKKEKKSSGLWSAFAFLDTPAGHKLAHESVKLIFILVALGFVFFPAYRSAGKAYDESAGLPSISMKQRNRMIVSITLPILIPSAAFGVLFLAESVGNIGQLIVYGFFAFLYAMPTLVFSLAGAAGAVLGAMHGFHKSRTACQWYAVLGVPLGIIGCIVIVGLTGTIHSGVDALGFF